MPVNHVYILLWKHNPFSGHQPDVHSLMMEAAEKLSLLLRDFFDTFKMGLARKIQPHNSTVVSEVVTYYIPTLGYCLVGY